MLRVRPVVNTPHAGAWAELLLALGLQEMTQLPATASPAGSEKRCFAADSGRVLVQEAATFDTELLFEVRDLEKFASWTISDGTPVRLQPDDGGNGSQTLARITAPDGLVFTALAVDSLATLGTPRHTSGSIETTEGQLAILALWHTSDVPGAAATLANIGAKPDATTTENGTWARHRAKHGGFVAAHAGDKTRIELSLEYAGDIETLANHLSSAGLAQSLFIEAYGRTLQVDHPDGGQLWINEIQGDLYEKGYPFSGP